MSKATTYRPFLVGNDTPLTAKDIAPHKQSTDFALVGTSLFRSIEIACQLRAKDMETIIPKVVIVDNSTIAMRAWSEIKQYFGRSAASNWEDFLKGSDIGDDDGWLDFTIKILASEIGVEVAGTAVFFRGMSSSLDFNLVKSVVAQSQFLLQDWRNPDVFSQIREFFQTTAIIAYHSNIIGCIPKLDDKLLVIKSLQVLNPVFSLCTNFDPSARIPTRGHVIPDHSEEFLKDLLLPKEPVPRTSQVGLYAQKYDHDAGRKDRHDSIMST